MCNAVYTANPFAVRKRAKNQILIGAVACGLSQQGSYPAVDILIESEVNNSLFDVCVSSFWIFKHKIIDLGVLYLCLFSCYTCSLVFVCEMACNHSL